MHTFLLNPNNWKATGIFTNSSEETFSVNGIFSISHNNANWILKVHLSSSVETDLYNPVFVIEPFISNSPFTQWKMSLPPYENMEGRFMIVEKDILSVGNTDDKVISFTEYIRKVSDDFYKSRGFIMQGSKIVSSWNLFLKRKESAE